MIPQTNCLSDVFFEEAIECAKALDDHLTRTGQVVGPLHGLPISLKDNFNIKGKDSTVGFTSLVGKPAEYNATLVDILEKLGAVRYCKTNVPTAMMIVCIKTGPIRFDDSRDLGGVGE
jgi:amidase